MSDLSTYSLSDFILFSGRTYYRMFALYHEAIWPVHIIAVVFLSLILLRIYKPVVPGRVLGTVLVISWLWVAVMFMYQRYYQIHVVANGYAYAFMIEAVLLAWNGVYKNNFKTRESLFLTSRLGLLFVVLGGFVYPLLSLLMRSSAMQFELFALTPDATALVTLGVLLLYKANWWLMIIPLFWIVISAMTLAVM